MSDTRHTPGDPGDPGGQDGLDEVFSDKDSLKADTTTVFDDNTHAYVESASEHNASYSVNLQKPSYEHALSEQRDDVPEATMWHNETPHISHNVMSNDIYDLTEEERDAIYRQHMAPSFEAHDYENNYADGYTADAITGDYNAVDTYDSAEESVFYEGTEQDDSVEDPQEIHVPLSMAEKVFRGMDRVSVLCIFLLFLLHVAASIWFSSGYFHSEQLVVQTFQHMVKEGQWVISPSFDVTMMPGYYWFMALIALIPMPVGFFLPVLTAASGLVAVMGTYTLAWCLMPKGKREGVPFVTGLLLLTSPAFMTFGHMVLPEVLTAGLLAFALALLYRGWVSSSGLFCFLSGFIFAALAVFVGGAVPLWVVLCGSLLFTLWRTTFRRAHRPDAVIGFACFVLLFAAWLVVVILLGGEGAASLDTVLLYFIAPFMPPYWPIETDWMSGILLCVILLLPWTLVPIFVNWLTVIGGAVPQLKASRKENAGGAWAWITLTVGCLVLIRQSNMSLQAVIILLPLVAFLLAKALCHLSAKNSRVFFLFVALLLLGVGAVFTFVSVPATASLWVHAVPPLLKDMILATHGLPFVASVLLVAAVILFKFTRREFARGTLLGIAFFACVLVQSMTVLVIPSFVNNTFESYEGGRFVSSHPLGNGMGVFPYGVKE